MTTRQVAKYLGADFSDYQRIETSLNIHPNFRCLGRGHGDFSTTFKRVK